MAMTFSMERLQTGLGDHARYGKLTATWTANGSGVATGTSPAVVGELIKAILLPGDSSPSNLYDVTLTDEDGVNVLAGSITGLGNQSSSSTPHETYLLFQHGASDTAGFWPVVGGPLTFSVANAGALGEGIIVLYFRF